MFYSRTINTIACVTIEGETRVNPAVGIDLNATVSPMKEVNI